MANVSRTISCIRSILTEQANFRIEGRKYCRYDLRFVTPAGFSILASFHKKNPWTLSLDSFTDPDVRSFMVRANLFYVTGVTETSSCYSWGSSNLLEVCSVSNSGETNEISQKIAGVSRTFARRNNDEWNFFLENLKYVSMELLNNVVDHSGDVSTNFVSAQNYWWVTPCFQVAVADSGIGLLRDISVKYPFITNHQSAIFKAFEGHVSGKIITGPYQESSNAGLWLTVTSKMVHDNNGDFAIWTWDALYYTDSESGEWHTETIPHWDGTFAFFNTYPSKGNIYDHQTVLDSIYGNFTENPLDIDFG